MALETDSGVTLHGRNLAELELMAKGGMSPAQALAAATSSAAELLGMAGELGTLEPGKRADVVAVDGDPFELATIGDRIAAWSRTAAWSPATCERPRRRPAGGRPPGAFPLPQPRP